MFQWRGGDREGMGRGREVNGKTSDIVMKGNI